MATAFLCAHIHPSNLAPRVGDIYVPSFECWDVAVSAPLSSPRAHAVHRQWQRQAAGGSRFDHHQTAEGKKKKKSIDRALYICACVFSIAICKQGVAIKKCTLPRESSQAAGGYVRCLCVQVPEACLASEKLWAVEVIGWDELYRVQLSCGMHGSWVALSREYCWMKLYRRLATGKFPSLELLVKPNSSVDTHLGHPHCRQPVGADFTVRSDHHNWWTARTTT